MIPVSGMSGSNCTILPLRMLEAICFSLAESWFECRLPESVREEMERLPADVKRWLATYCLVADRQACFGPTRTSCGCIGLCSIGARPRGDGCAAGCCPSDCPARSAQRTFQRARSRGACACAAELAYLKYLASRLSHHARALPPTLWSAVRWFGAGLELGPEYWRFLASEGFFDFGMFVFFFLYNLYLLKLGFRENFLGLMSGLMTAANIAGSILSVFAIQRFGMRRDPHGVVHAGGRAVGVARGGHFRAGVAGAGALAGLAILGVAGGTGSGPSLP